MPLTSSQQFSPKTPAPSFTGLVVACLVLDLVIVLLLWPDSAYYRPKSYTPIGLGILLGQFGLMGGIRLRYSAQRWLAYGAMVALTAIGGLVLRSEVGSRDFYPAALLYLVGSLLFALACIVPGAIVQARYRGESGLWYRFQLKHHLAAFIVLGTLFAMLTWYGRILTLVSDVYLLGLPSIVANLALAQTSSIRRFSWALLITLSSLMLLVLSLRAFDATVLFGFLLGQGVTIWLGGIYLLSFPQRKALFEETETPDPKPTDTDAS